MSIKHTIKRIGIEFYLIIRSFGYGLYAIMWMIVQKLIKLYRRLTHSARSPARRLYFYPVYQRGYARKTLAKSYYRRRSKIYDLKTARILRRIAKYF